VLTIGILEETQKRWSGSITLLFFAGSGQRSKATDEFRNFTEADEGIR